MFKKKKKIIKFIKKHLTSVLTVGSLLVSIWALVWSCKTEEELEETNYKLTSVEHRPMLRFFEPKLIGLELLLDSIRNSGPNQSQDTVDIKSYLQLRLKLNLRNIGNSTAKILGYIFTDTITDNQVINEYLRATDKSKILIDSILSDYTYKELTIYDTLEIAVTHTLRYIDNNNKFIIHFIIYYENELKQRYETYYWVRGKLNEYGFSPSYDPITKKIRFLGDEKAYLNIVEFIDENNISNVYPVEQREESIDLLEKLQN